MIVSGGAGSLGVGGTSGGVVGGGVTGAEVGSGVVVGSDVTLGSLARSCVLVDPQPQPNKLAQAASTRSDGVRRVSLVDIVSCTVSGIGWGIGRTGCVLPDLRKRQKTAGSTDPSASRARRPSGRRTLRDRARGGGRGAR